MVHAALAMTWEFADESALQPAVAARLAVIVDELVGNLLRHGSAPQGVRVELLLANRGGEVIVVIEDNCAPFDPRDVEFAGPDAETGGGVGLALVRGLADILAYESDGGANRLTLRVHS